MITLAARDSLLSKAQVEEVITFLSHNYPHLSFYSLFIKTQGDFDKKTSLRILEKTDFFTKEIDDLVLDKKCDAGIHSAKDLPEPLRRGLCIAIITPCLDPRDALVYKNNIPKEPLIGTSSFRRERNVQLLFPKARFVDIRGTIHERLSELDKQCLDGIVIAEAALIRLKLTSLSRIYLPGDTTPLQGSLAIVIREDNDQMKELFKPLMQFSRRQ